MIVKDFTIIQSITFKFGEIGGLKIYILKKNERGLLRRRNKDGPRRNWQERTKELVEKYNKEMKQYLGLYQRRNNKQFYKRHLKS